MTWVIAHRGASRDCPENTLAAFDEALRQGCDAIELDVQLSRDGTPMVYHDKTLARAGGGRQRLSRLSAGELGQLDAGARSGEGFRGQRIPTLEQVLKRYAKRTRLLVELKTREGARGRARHVELARRAATLVSSLQLEKRVLMLSFDGKQLATCAEVAPAIGRVLNLKPPPLLEPELRQALADLFALSVDVRTLTPGFAAAVRLAGGSLLAFTCNTARRVAQALDAGAIGVISDRPGWLAREMQRRGART